MLQVLPSSLANDTLEPGSEPRWIQRVIAGFGTHPLECSGLPLVIKGQNRLRPHYGVNGGGTTTGVCLHCIYSPRPPIDREDEGFLLYAS
jgi:hypothetical protein